jgi:hypothetical protein
MHPNRKLNLSILRAAIPVIMTTYSYTGVYEKNDPAHPNGSSFTYVDINGVSKNKLGLWSDTCFTFESQSPPTNKVGIATCVPNTAFAFQILEGSSACQNGRVTFVADTGPKLLYSTSNQLKVGIALFKDEALTIPATTFSIKAGTKVYDLNAGIIDLELTINNPC